MNLTSPNIKGTTQHEINNNTKRYLFSLVEQLNWALGTIQNNVDLLKKTASKTEANETKTIHFKIGDAAASLTFERVGMITFATLSGALLEDVTPDILTATVEIPEAFRPESVPNAPFVVFAENADGFSPIGSVRFQSKSKIFIQCNFFVNQEFFCQFIFKN